MKGYMMLSRTLLWLTLAVSPVAFSAGIEAGQWEFSVKNEMEGLPPPQHALKLSKCIDKADAANLLKVVPLVPGATPDSCELSNQKANGSRTSFSLSCSGYPQVKGEGEVQLAGASLSGSTKSLLDSNTYQKHLTQTFTGKRVGACK